MRTIQTKLYYPIECPNPRIEQLCQLTNLTWDGDLINKTETRLLHTEGLITRLGGWNIINSTGLAILHEENIIRP